MDRSSAEGALVVAPKAPRGVGCGDGVSPNQKFFLLFDLTIEPLGAVFKLDVMKETRTQLQEDKTIATRKSCTGRSPVRSIGHAPSCRRRVATWWKEQTRRSQNCKYLP